MHMYSIQSTKVWSWLWWNAFKSGGVYHVSRNGEEKTTIGAMNILHKNVL